MGSVDGMRCSGALLLAVALSVMGCGDDDGGLAADGGGPGVDAGTGGGEDAGGGGATDAGATGEDAGGGGATDAGGGGATDAGGPAPVEGCTEVGLELIGLVNAYRRDNGLPDIPASPSLCTVAATHTRDLADNSPHGGECNLHSWSDAGDWSACCYTSDHARASCMWDKPRELTDYPGNGYENSYAGSSDPASALAAWQRSGGHNAVILNEGSWAGMTWRALGADVHEGYAVLWFGAQDDPAR